MIAAKPKEKDSEESFDYLDEESLFRLLDSIKKERDYLIIRILYDLGCTLKELVNIRIRDIDFEEQTVSIRKGNARKNEERVSMISEDTSRRLKSYLSRIGILEKKVAYLFQTKRGTSLTTRRVCQIIEKRCADAKIAGKQTSQLIKYTHIAHAYMHDLPIYAIEAQVGLAMQRLAQIFKKIDTGKKTSHYRIFFQDIGSKDHKQKRLH